MVDLLLSILGCTTGLLGVIAGAQMLSALLKRREMHRLTQEEYEELRERVMRRLDEFRQQEKG